MEENFSEEINDKVQNDSSNNNEELKDFNDNEIAHAVQIIDIKKHGNSKYKFILKEKELSKILNLVGNREVAIKAIAGPSRQGKSFMLSFMLRYLESDSKDDWIGRSKPEQSLQGFHWKNGDDAETLGIWMWSKPYICKNSTGKEIAILLLDTQGVFDDILTTREWAIIVGLCLLTCSSTIFNLFSHLQENSLQILDTFMTYGLIAMNKNSEDESEEEPPFQKLIFLIRDHNNPDQFPYGGIGGKNLLEKKLKIKENMQRETQHTRKHIKECFTDLECFLMPPIGEKAKRVTYDGNLKDLPENFISCLEEFISELLDPEFIIPKVIAGNRIKGNELMEYFKIYLDKFNSGDIPDAMPLLDATAFATYSNATQEAVHQIYFPMMNNKVKKSKFLSDEEIQKLHKNAAQKANQVVENKPKIGDPKILKDALINLNRILDFEFKIMMDENTAKRDKFLKKAVDDCIKEFKMGFESKANNTFWMNNDEIEDLFLKLESKSFEYFESFSIDEETLLPFKEKLRDNISTLKSNFVSENDRKYDRAVKSCTRAVESGLQEYDTQMNNKFLNQEFYRESDFIEIHSDSVVLAKKVFFESEKSGDNDFILNYENNLETKINRSQTEFKKLNRNNLEACERKCEKDVKEAIKFYEESGKAMINNEILDFEEFDEIEKEIKDKTKTYYENKRENLKDSNLIEEYSALFESSLSESRSKLVEKFEKNVKEREQNLTEYVKQEVEDYETILQQNFNSKKHLKNEEITTIFEKFSQESKERFENNFKKVTKIENKFLEKLKFELEKTTNKQIKDNNERNEELKRNVIDLMNKIKKEYILNMKTSINQIIDWQEFDNQHKRLKNNSLEEFESANEGLEDSWFEEKLTELSDYIDFEYQNLQKDFKEKRDMILKLGVREQLENYSDRMNKYLNDNYFISDEQLNDLNQTTSEEVLAALEMTAVKINEEENEFFMTLKDKMTEVFKKILAQNLKKKKELEEIERKSLNKIKEEYSDEMKLYFNEYHNRKESDERHNKIKKELIEKHETTSALRGSDLIENLMLQISQEIDDIYQNILKSIHDIEKSKAEKLVEIKSNEYVQKLNDRINENTFIDKNEILESNKFFSDEVLVSFKNEINKDFEESHLKLITANLDRSLSEILIDFERKTETSIKDSQILLIQIIDSYVNKIKPLLNESTSDENFQIKHQELKAESMNIFKDKNTLKDRNKFEELLNNLESKLEEEFKVLLEKVEQKKYDFYEKLSTEIVNDYRKTMIENIERSDLISNDELLKLHEKYTEEAFSVLNKSITGTSELEKSFKQKLETRINVVFQNFIEENVKKEQNSISYCQNLMSELKTTYLTNMNPFLDGMTNKEKLNHQHEQEKNKCVEEFKQNSLSNQLWFQNLVDKLTEIIDCEFKNVQKLFTKNRESYIKSIINLCTNHYKNKISNGKTSEDFIAEDSLKRKHESLIEETQKKFKETVINISADEEIYLKKLEENILKIFENFKADNTKKKELLINKIQLIIKELKNSYMSKTRLFMNEEEEEILIKEHEKNKSELIDQFDRLFHAIDPNFMINFKEELIGEIEKDFKDLKDLFKLTSENNRSRVNAALESAKKCYKNEMDKYLENNIYFTEAELENRHGISADLALKVLREKIDNISLKHEEKLKNSLKIIYDQYQKTNKLNDKNINAMGIDLGTTYSCAAIVIRGKVTFVPNGRGRTTTPSYVSFNDSGDVMVGDLAKDQAHQNPANTIFDVKRLIGRDFDDENVKNDMQLWPFRVVDEDKKPKIELRCSKRRRFHPEEISAIILKKLKDDTKAYLGYEIKNAIITVPAYFNDAQRQATKCAGAIAGLNVLKILNEPTAAAVAYTHQMKDDGKRNVLVYDLGGGTFDVAVVVLNEGVIDVKAVGGDSHLGGQDFDQRLVLLCMQEFKKQSKKKIDRDEKALLRLRRFCEKVKWDLSANSQATVSIDELIKGHDFCYNITRAKFEEINIDLFEKTMQHVTNVLKDAGLSASQIDDIVTVGGSSRVPKIQEMLSIYFGGKVLNKSINPDEAVAYGAAIQAAIMDGTALDEYSKEIQDVAPFSIGIRLKDGVYSVIIPKNSKLPNKKSKDYQTSEDNQTKVEITIFEGEDEIADRNRLLGRFMIEGIPKKLVGEEKIKVLMEIDDEGILHVTGRVESNSQSNTIKIKDHRNKISEGELRMLINKAKDTLI